jgi:hypothetical protein
MLWTVKVKDKHRGALNMMRKLIAIVGIALLVTSCATSSPTTPSPQVTPTSLSSTRLPATKTFNDPQGRYTLERPSAWQQRQTEFDEVIFESSDGQSVLGAAVMPPAIRLMDVDLRTVDPFKLWSFYVDPGAKTIVDHSSRIDRALMTFRGTSNGKKVAGVLFVFRARGQVLSSLYQTSSDRWPQEDDSAIALAQTLRAKE